MNIHGHLNYVEFHAIDIPATKEFFEKAFGWEFVDYGPEYTSFSDVGLDGGFFQSDQISTAEKGAPLLVFYSAELEETQATVEVAGGKISQSIFSFPGGRRFHFLDPNGNEFAVWSEKNEDGTIIA